MDGERDLKRKSFVEEVGIFFEQAGMPRMTGRILGCLMLSDPPRRSLDELAEALMASKGSISTATNFLIQIALIERVSLPGVRHDYFSIRPSAFQHALKHGTERITKLRELAERGLELVGNEDTLTRQRLEEVHAMYSFFEREYPALLERWEQERAKLQSRLV